jgi:hypothetical protein
MHGWEGKAELPCLGRVYQTFEQGRWSDVGCACHWTVNVAASPGHGELYADVYSVAAAGPSCQQTRRSMVQVAEPVAAGALRA